MNDLEKSVKRLELIVKEMQNYLAHNFGVDFEPFEDEYNNKLEVVQKVNEEKEK